jgi:hypothetical protein
MLKLGIAQKKRTHELVAVSSGGRPLLVVDQRSRYLMEEVKKGMWKQIQGSID